MATAHDSFNERVDRSKYRLRRVPADNARRVIIVAEGDAVETEVGSAIVLLCRSLAPTHSLSQNDANSGKTCTCNDKHKTVETGFGGSGVLRPRAAQEEQSQLTIPGYTSSSTSTLHFAKGWCRRRLQPRVLMLSPHAAGGVQSAAARVQCV